MPTYVIAPDPRIPAHETVPLLRRIWLRLTFRRPPRVVILTRDNVLVCNPDSAEWVAAWLRKQGHQYQMRLSLAAGQK